MRRSHAQQGSAFILTLFFSALFIIMFGATLSYILIQHKAVQHEVWKAQSLAMAEAGVQYYRWHLAHDPEDFVTDTGTHDFDDPYGDQLGEYTITVTPPETGSTMAVITTIANTVFSDEVQARVRVRYGKPTLAHYAFITNSNVWFGESEQISGELHSNGGVRMDGVGDSLFTSDELTYICGPEHGCSYEEKPGIWGTGDDPMFWEYPVDEIDFNSLLLDLNDLEDDAGYSLPDSGSYGYYVVFNADGTFTVNTVTAVYSPVYGYDGTQWTYESNDKQSWTPVAGQENVPIPDNGIMFFADDVWVGGDVNGRATLAAARLPDGSYTRADIYIQDDITYTSHDGTSALALVAQQDVLAPLRSEDILEIDGALMAINGHVFRYYYPAWGSEPYNTFALRTRIETYGTLITNTIWTWSWVQSETGPVVSGYENTETNYDPDLNYAPPPSFPTEDEYAFISWEELTLDED